MKGFIRTAIAMIALTILGSCASASQTKATEEPQDQAVDAAHTTKNSVDWAGVYTGTIPAADGPGIEVSIELRDDDTYTLSYTYIDRDGGPVTASGTFTWDEAWNIITLNDSEGLPPYYFVGEHRLTQLDMSKNVITGDFADMYILQKTLAP